MQFITLKEASKLVDKAPLTVRRRIKSAPKDKQSTNDKGHLLVDRDYILEVFTIKVSEPINEQVSKVDSLSSLEKELNNKQKTIDSLNERLSESLQVVGSQHKQILGLSNSLLEINQKIIEEQTPAEIAPIETKKSFPLLEVVSIGVSIVFAGAIIFYVLFI